MAGILDDLRAAWDARPPTRTRTRVAWTDRIGVSWHWIGPGRGPAGDHAGCLERVREWQAQHQAKGWKDIGYNALICKHARAIEGRGLEFSGSHSPGVNVAHVGVQFMVGEDDAGPTPAMYERAVRLRADLADLGRNIRRDWGHRDDPAASTACPGNTIYKWVHAGGPGQELDVATPREIASDLLGWDTIPSSRIPFDVKRETVDVRTALGYAMVWSLEARDAALAAAAAKVDPTALATALAPILVELLPDAGAVATAEELEAALRKVLGSVDEVTPA